MNKPTFYVLLLKDGSEITEENFQNLLQTDAEWHAMPSDWHRRLRYTKSKPYRRRGAATTAFNRAPGCFQPYIIIQPLGAVGDPIKTSELVAKAEKRKAREELLRKKRQLDWELERINKDLMMQNLLHAKREAILKQLEGLK
jgi:hypothetical protein